MMNPVLERQINTVDDIMQRGTKVVIPAFQSLKPGEKYVKSAMRNLNQRMVKYSYSFEDNVLILPLSSYIIPGEQCMDRRYVHKNVCLRPSQVHIV